MTTFCQGCGGPQAGADHTDCAQRLAVEPPRYCATCGFRLDVQVYPNHVETSCRECRRRGFTSVAAP
ncbi:MAG: hypothetical protein ACRDZO_25380 [Egibacteraceae bacterium]